MIIVTLFREATAERIHIPAESQFTKTMSDRDMEKLHHEAAMEYRSLTGMGVTVTHLIELQEMVISKFETHLGKIENIAGKFLDNLLEIYPGTHDCQYAKSTQSCKDRRETSLLLWHQAIFEYGNLKIGLQYRNNNNTPINNSAQCRHKPSTNRHKNIHRNGILGNKNTRLNHHRHSRPIQKRSKQQIPTNKRPT